MPFQHKWPAVFFMLRFSAEKLRLMNGRPSHFQPGIEMLPRVFDKVIQAKLWQITLLSISSLAAHHSLW